MRERRPCCGVSQVIVARLLSVPVLLGQGVLLDLFLVKYGSSAHYAWAMTDALAVIVWIALLLRPDLVKTTYRACCSSKNKTDGEEYQHPVLSSMWFAWLFYGVVGLSPRVCYVYYSIAPDLSEQQSIGPNLLKITVALTAVLFLCLVTAHETAHGGHELKLYLERVTVGVVLDLIDTGEFLDVFFTEDHRVGKEELGDKEFKLSTTLARVILVFVVLSIIVPTFGLVEMEYKVSKIKEHTEGRKRRSNAKLMYLWARMCSVNLPFFIIRVVLWTEHNRQVSVLIVKNFILVILDGLDLWEFHVGDNQQDRLTSSTSTTSESVAYAQTGNIELHASDQNSAGNATIIKENNTGS